MTTPTSPGWYDDPDQPGHQRWWGESGWADSIVEPGWHDDPNNPKVRRYWDGMEWTKREYQKSSKSIEGTWLISVPRWVVVLCVLLIVLMVAGVAFAAWPGGTTTELSPGTIPTRSTPASVVVPKLSGPACNEIHTLSSSLDLIVLPNSVGRLSYQNQALYYSSYSETTLTQVSDAETALTQYTASVHITGATARQTLSTLYTQLITLSSAVNVLTGNVGYLTNPNIGGIASAVASNVKVIDSDIRALHASGSALGPFSAGCRH